MTQTVAQIEAAHLEFARNERAASNAYIIQTVIGRLSAEAERGSKFASRLLEHIEDFRHECDRVISQGRDNADMACSMVDAKWIPVRFETVV